MRILIHSGPTKSNISAYANDMNHSLGCPTAAAGNANLQFSKPKAHNHLIKSPFSLISNHYFLS